MYLIVSAFVSFLLRPITWIFIILLRGIFAKPQRNRNNNRYFWYAGTVLFLFTNPLFFNFFSYRWETPPVSMYKLSTYDVGVILGGIQEFGTQEVDDRLIAPSVSGRVTTSVELYHLGKLKHIIIAGGDAATMKSKSELEAPFIKNALIRMGVPDSVIIIENASTTTRENAVFTQKIIAEKGFKSVLLLTSANHMPRSYACFSKVGVNCAAFPTDPWTEELTTQPRSFISPNAKFLTYWQHLLREWVGYVVYKIKGEV
jgi:uncharacterized SAM-binding protein YcdF (DUF218 family)